MNYYKFSKAIKWLAAISMLGYASCSLASTLTNVKILSDNQLIFDLDGSTDYQAFFLNNPERLVIDFPHATLQKNLQSISLKTIPVFRIRDSYSSEKLRVVLDLKKCPRPSITIKKSLINGQWQLLLNFTQAAKPSFPPIGSPKKAKLSNMAASTSASITPDITSESSFRPGRLTLSDIQTNTNIVSADTMIPLWTERGEMIFSDFMGSYGSNDTYVLSPGGGFRKIIKNQIIGAYFFGDYSKMSLNENFWTLNPGVEWMNTRWDAHLNGYFPTATSKQISDSVFASTTGDERYITFEAGTHNQYDKLVQTYDVIGNGVDTEIGYSFAGQNNYRSRVYLGGYYYDSSKNLNNIEGATAGFEQPLTKNLSISVFNSYDNLNHYLVGAGLTLTFGDDSTLFTNHIEDRLLAPVERHIGIVGTGSGFYDQMAETETTSDNGNPNFPGLHLQYNNVYFISPNGTGNGTYDSPMPLTQTSVDTIYSEMPNSSRIYIQGNSTYTINNTTAPNTFNAPSNGYNPTAVYQGLIIHNNQNLYGRSSDYKTTAQGSERPLIDVKTNTGFILNNGDNALNNLQITTSTADQGIVYFDTNGNYTFSVVNSSISGFVASGSSNGLLIENTKQNGAINVYLTDSNFNNNTTGVTINQTSSPGQVTLNAQNSTFNSNTTYGIALYQYNSLGNLTVNLNNSQFNNNTLYGLNYNSGATMNLTAINSQFNNNGQDGLVILSSGDLTLAATGSQFNNNGGTGLFLLASSSQSVFNITNLSGSSFNNNTDYGIYMSSTANININLAGTTITGNGIAPTYIGE